MVATGGGAEVEGQGKTALLGVARTWASPPTPLHAGLTPNHALVSKLEYSHLLRCFKQGHALQQVSRENPFPPLTWECLFWEDLN